MSCQAVSYHKRATFQKQESLFLINKIPLQAGMKKIDVGCGTGFSTFEFEKHVGPNGIVVGIDPDMTRIKLAKKSYGFLPNLSYQIGSSENFQKNKYDIIYSSFVLHWIKDKRRVLELMFQNLKYKGAVLAITVVVKNFPILNDLNNTMNEKRARELQNLWYFEECDT